MKNNKLKEYFNTLSNGNMLIEDFLDYNKAINNIEDILFNLHSLNYIIHQDKNIFNNKIEKLFIKSPDCFSCIPILLAIRKKDNKKLILENEYIEFNEIHYSLEKIKYFFYNSGIFELIKKGYIKNFVDYVSGIEVGMGTNSRKNISGKKLENLIENYLKTLSKDFTFMTQVKGSKCDLNYPLIKDKIFDFVVINKINNKKYFIESSYYNTSGSKISETSGKYWDINNLFKKQLNNKNNYFYWIADGQGMKTIKNDLENKINDDYIYNFSQINKIF